MTLTQWIRVEDLRRRLEELEQVLGIELSATNPSGELLVGRKLPKERGGFGLAPVALSDGHAAGLWCRGDGKSFEECTRLARLVASILAREAEANRTLRGLLSSTKRLAEELNFLYEMSSRLHVTMDARETSKLILDQLVQLMSVERASILLFGKDGQLYIQAARGLAAEVVDRARPALGEGIAGWVAEKRRPLLVEDVRRPPAEVADLVGRLLDTSARSFISVPLLVQMKLAGTPGAGKEELVGVLNLTDRFGDQAFTPDDLKLVSAVAAQAATVLQNCLLLERARQAENLRREVEMASRIQKALVPPRAPRIDGVDVFVSCEPAPVVTGDYYDFFLQEPGVLRVVIADTSAYGVASLILMSSLRSALFMLHSMRLSPGQVAEQLNSMICNAGAGQPALVTGIFLELDARTGSLRYANAGHPRPLLVRPFDDTAFLETEGAAAGFGAGTSYDEGLRLLRSDDVLVLYTEGLVQAASPKGQSFGLERLVQAVRTNAHRTARQITEAVDSAVRSFCEEAPVTDDRTLVVLKVDR